MKQNHGFLKGALAGALAVLLVMGLASCGIAQSAIEKITGKSDGALSGIIATDEKMEFLNGLIESYYTGEVDEKALEDGIYKGYVEALGDPYSVYYDEEETKALMESTSGEYSGLGAVLSQDRETGVITVVQVYEGSPAEQAGIRAEDILYKVNDEEVTGIDLSNVVTHIRGEEGTTVDVTVLRGEGQEEIAVTATRAVIEVKTVAYEMKENRTGYIQVTEFDSVTYEQYKEALEALETEGMERLVVDLRANPGGNLDTVVDILDLMLPEGTIVSMKDKQGEETKYDSDEAHQFKKPMAVLVNGYSASASEIYAGAIQDFGLGEIIGTQTYGKGVVQKLFDLKDGTCLKLTIAEYYTPSGRSINGEGVTPDVVVEYEPDAENPEYDNQLQKAMEIVSQK